ncbi:glycoside hydrolase family 15 protein [Propionivibrio soli]|uniref:glycoside hydrolase family 15 protein n=1 Tax=Propionivibrio soli TaxID=2976531 RepID=UPI0021E73B7D|nr:glycoside hydrolase family 15 protein [Propionivibrio soli]
MKWTIRCDASRALQWSRRRILCAAVFALSFLVGAAQALEAPCPPGRSSVWAPAAKDFLGTSASGNSRVYFTGAEGILTEVFYPTLDKVQNVDLQFLVTDASRTWGDEERRQRQHTITQVNKRAMLWQATTTADSGRWRITKKIFSDSLRNAVIQRVVFQTLEPGRAVKDYNLYVLNNPAINNSGAGNGNAGQCGEKQGAAQGADNSRTLAAGNRTMLVASEPNSTSSALAVSLPWKAVGGNPMVSSGFVGTNDGFTDLFSGGADKTMDFRFDGAFGGNVAQIGWIDTGNSTATSISFDVVLAFGSNETEAMNVANATLNTSLNAMEQVYVDDWIAYSQTLNNQNGTADDQYYLAAMTLKTIQDKSNGAMVAGPGTPWGETSGDGNPGGYHLIWSRDLFKFASALIAAGDTTSGNSAVDFLFNRQMQTSTSDSPYSRPGRFPQNSFVDGTPYWNGTQMDETAMPIILAWKLNRVDLWPRIKLAAEFLAHNGPSTGQERWEEMGGYSPSTIAAEIAGLVCAASLANAAGDSGAAAFYLQKADEWRNNVANWTFTSTGFHTGCPGCNGKYYIRINANQDPNDDVNLTFGNGVGTHGERYIVDGGFLELVRMGVMSPSDWTILDTLPEYDALLKQTLAGKGDAWFRYNFDGYGEYNDGRNYDGSGRGRLWPIFTAERGIYEIAKSGDGTKGQPYRAALKAFSSQAGFIPEQIWNISANITGWQTDTPPSYAVGSATKSMQPLSWAMGEYINLVAAMNQGRSDAPTVVCQRYACDKPQTTVTFQVTANTNFGENIYLVGNSPLLSDWTPSSGIKLAPTNYPVWNATVSLPAGTALEYKYVKRDASGNTVWEGGGNRSFTIPSSGVVTRNDVFQ